MVTMATPAPLRRLRAKRIIVDRIGVEWIDTNGVPGDLFDPDCPTRLVLDRVGDKWTALVVLLLSDGPLRFTKLRGYLGRVAPKVLTESLRRMERDGLVTREIFAEVPPRVEYTLTELGRSLIEPISIISDWAEVHVNRITAAQEAYDARHSHER
jgi:DNA-binding HxlR family transcriptional regulator